MTELVQVRAEKLSSAAIGLTAGIVELYEDIDIPDTQRLPAPGDL
jgi:hypothetical protein